MSSNLDSLLAKIQEQADLIDKINTRSDFRYKSIQSLVLEYGKPFIKKVKSPFKGEPKSCFKNCFQALWKYPKLSYCEGFGFDEDVDLVISHAWLANDSFEVIDPTWIGDKFKDTTYFGIIFDREFVMKMAEKNRCYGILDNDYMNRHQLLREGFPPSALHPIFHSIKKEGN